MPPTTCHRRRFEDPTSIFLARMRGLRGLGSVLCPRGQRYLATKTLSLSEGSSPFPAIEIPDVPFTEFIQERFEEFIAADAASSSFPRPAIIDGITGDARSWKQLVADTDLAAAWLRDTVGLGAGDVLAIVSPNHVDYFSVMHAALKLGASVNPVNPVLMGTEVSTLVRESASKAIVAHPDCLEAVLDALGSWRTVYGDAPPPLVVLTDVGADAAEGVSRRRPSDAMAYDDIRWSGPTNALGAGDMPAVIAQAPLPEPSLAALPYSSGTTGKPKGVMLTHRNLVANVLQVEAPEFAFYSRENAKAAVLSPLPMFHIYPFTMCLSALLRHGHTYVTMKRFDLQRYCELIHEYQVERSYIVPPIILQLAKMPPAGRDAGQEYLSTLRMVISAAAPLSTEIEEAFVARHPQCSIKQCWGMSELSPFGTFTPDDARRAGTVGVACANTEWRLVRPPSEANNEAGSDVAGPCVDAADFEVVPLGERGELCIRGPQVMLGYRDDEEKTSECLGRLEAGQESGWLRTGDVAIADKDGFLWIVDRIKELIKYKGHQVAPAELEAVLLSHPDVLDAAVVGIPAPEASNGEVPRAFVVLKDVTIAPSATSIQAYVDERVNPFMRLRGGLEIIDKIPKSAAGKLLRRILTERALADHTTRLENQK